MFFCEYFKIFNNTYFEEYLRTSASIDVIIDYFFRKYFSWFGDWVINTGKNQSWWAWGFFFIWKYTLRQSNISKHHHKQPSRGVLRKSVLKICSIFTGEHSCQSAISIKLQSNFIEITLRHGCSPVNLLHIFRTCFYKNTSWWLLLQHLLKTDISRYIAMKTKTIFVIKS